MRPTGSRAASGGVRRRHAAGRRLTLRGDLLLVFTVSVVHGGLLVPLSRTRLGLATRAAAAASSHQRNSAASACAGGAATFVITNILGGIAAMIGIGGTLSPLLTTPLTVRG
jgi:branched-chain amino acid transport system permease protein